jgi:hypothetical protein
MSILPRVGVASFVPTMCAALVVCVLAGAAACSDDDDEVAGGALLGSNEGVERWVVHFETGAPDLTAYHAALDKDGDTASIELQLREQAMTRRQDFARAVGELGGKIVDYWWLTNAVTVEIPVGNVKSLKMMSDVKELTPDRLLE